MEIDYKVTADQVKNLVNKNTKAGITSKQAESLLEIYESTIRAGFDQYLRNLTKKLFT